MIGLWKTTAAELVEMSLYSELHLEPAISILSGERCAVQSGLGSSKRRTIVVSTRRRFKKHNILNCVRRKHVESI